MLDPGKVFALRKSPFRLVVIHSEDVVARPDWGSGFSRACKQRKYARESWTATVAGAFMNSRQEIGMVALYVLSSGITSSSSSSESLASS